MYIIIKNHINPKAWYLKLFITFENKAKFRFVFYLVLTFNDLTT